MAGHNKWSKIKHRKAVVDKRRGKAWTMCSRQIMVAAKAAGADPEYNFALRQALDDAKYHNVPKDNIDRAIKKGVGGGEGENYENVRYEGYGPSGVALVVEALTNNRTRTAADLRLIFSKFGGNMGTTGCVSFMFDTKGRIVVEGPATLEDRLFELAAGAGADDVKFEDDEDKPSFIILTSVPAFVGVKQAIDQAKLPVIESRIEQIPNVMAAVSGEAAKDIIDMIDALDDNDDVQRVYSNADIDEQTLADLS